MKSPFAIHIRHKITRERSIQKSLHVEDLNLSTFSLHVPNLCRDIKKAHIYLSIVLLCFPSFTTMSAGPPIQYYHHGRLPVAGGVIPDAITAYQTFGNSSNPCIVFPTCYGGKLDSAFLLSVSCGTSGEVQ